MPIDARLYAPNILPNTLLDAASLRSSLAFRDLVALSGGHDFLLQASNQSCAETAFGALRMPWIAAQLDAQALAALRAGGATFKSPALARAVAGQAGAASILLLFDALDVLFDGDNRCRPRLGVRVALGSMFRMPEEPGLARTPRLGETVQRFRDAVLDSPLVRSSPALLAAEAQSVQPPVMRTLSHTAPAGIDVRSRLELNRDLTIRQMSNTIDLGDRTSFEVSAWLGGGVLEIPAPFAVTSDHPSMTIRVAAELHGSSAGFTALTDDAAMLLSPSDPAGLAETITYRVRQRGSVPLVEDVSLVGGPATAKAGHLGSLTADAFPTRAGASSLNVGATVVAGRVAARNPVEFIGSSRYGVVWSADAVRLLVRHCWETHNFPRGIPQTETRRFTVNGVEQDAEAVSVFELQTLTDVELEFDSNGRRDVLYTNGSARVVPKFVRLRDGRELIPQNPDDPNFAPGKRVRWSAFGELTEDVISVGDPTLLTFLRAVTRGVTSRFGRPFADPPYGLLVTDSRISATAQRLAVLVK